MLGRSSSCKYAAIIMIATIIALIVILIRTLLVLAYSQTTILSLRPSSPFSVPAQGFYDSCAPEKGTPCYDRLIQMAHAGFTLVLNYDQFSGNAEQQLAYASRAEQLKIKIIWAMNSHAFWDGTNLSQHFQALAATCHCSDTQGFIQYFVGLVKNLPATWGYYIGDEVPPQNHDEVKAFADLVKQLDPSHPRLFIAGVSTVDSVTTNLAPFTDAADVLGADYYPVGSTSTPMSATGDIASMVESTADQANKQSAMVLQSFDWSQYPREAWRCSPFPSCVHFPTKSEMCQMLILTLSNAHPQILLWYSYYDILNSNNPSGYLQDLSDAVHTCNFSLQAANAVWRL